MNYIHPNGPVLPHPGGLQAPPSPTNLQLPTGPQQQQQPQQQPPATPLTPYRPQPNQSPTGSTVDTAAQPQSGIDPGITQRLQANRIAQIEAEARARGVVTPTLMAEHQFQSSQQKNQQSWEDKRQGAQNQFQLDQT